MSKFIKNISIFFLGFLPIIILVAYLFVKLTGKENIPPVRISDSISFNDKLHFARKKIARNIAIGSSITLNNVNSETIVNFLKTDNYLNLASWNLCIKDIYIMLEQYSKIQMPDTLFIVGCIEDFAKQQIKYKNPDDIYNVLTTDNTLFYYFKHPDVMYYITGVSEYKKYKSNDTIFESLNFDKYGQVKFIKKNFIKNQHRWNHVIGRKPIDNENYAYLDSILSFAATNNIQLYYIQSPVREGLLDSLDMKVINKHTKILKQHLSKYNFLFIDTYDKIWNDSLFVDATHMNVDGSKLFTEYFIDKIKKASEPHRLN